MAPIVESTRVGRVYGSRELLDDYGSRDTLFDDVSSTYGVPCARRSSDWNGDRKRKPFLILRYSRHFEEEESTEETDDTLKGKNKSIFKEYSPKLVGCNTKMSLSGLK